MADWKGSFQKGIVCFRSGKLEDALNMFSKAISSGGNEFSLYDSRAAVYEKLGKTKDALRDAKKVIDLAPHRWQGYARSARLFMKANKLDHSLHMVDVALARVPHDDRKRQSEIKALRDEILEEIQRQREHATKSFYHFGKLPLELATTIFGLALADDHAQVVRLAQVCRNWRAAILDTPSLWNILVLTKRNPVKKARTWAVRSKGRLVELRILPDLTSTPWALDELSSLSWNSLTTLAIAKLPLGELRARLPGLTAAVLCTLDTLDISHCVNVRDTSWLWSQPNMRLRNLRVDHSFFDWAAAANHFSLIESFSFNGPVMDSRLADIFLLLRRNTAMRQLTFRMLDIPVRRRLEDEEKVHLPHLTRLVVDGHDFAISQIVQLLDLPSLQALQIRGGAISIDVTLQHLLTSGAAASLTELRCNQCAVSAHVMIEILRSAVSLETLQLGHVGGPEVNEVLDALADPADIRPRSRQNGADDSQSTSATLSLLCPSLRHVNFSHCPGVRSGPLVRLVKSRLPIVNAADAVNVNAPDVQAPRPIPIEELIIDGCSAVEADILPWLRSKVRVVSCVYNEKLAVGRRR